MKKFYILLVTIMVTTLSFGQDIAVNGGFENWTAGVPDSWTTIDFNTTDLTEDTTTFVEGAKSAKITLMTQTQGDTDMRQLLTVVAGKTYDVSLQVYATDNQAKARIFGPGYNPSVYSDDTLLNQWQTLTYEYTATADEDVEFGIRFYDTSANWLGTGSIFYIDDLKIVARVDPSVNVAAPTSGTVFSPGTTNVDVEFTTANTNAGDEVNITVNGTTTTNVTSPFSVATTNGTTYDVTLELVNGGTTIDTATTDFSVGAMVQVADITALRADVDANGAGGFYEITGSSFVSHTDGWKNQHWIQDTNISGVLIYDDANTMTTYNVGEEISGLTGTTTFSAGVLRFIPTADTGTVVSTGNTITPQVVTIADFNANPVMYESELIQVNAVTYVGADGTVTFATGTNYDVTDGTDTLVSRTIFYSADYINQPIPSDVLDVVGVAGAYNGTAQIYVRNLDDMSVAGVSENTIEGFNLYPNPVKDVLNITTLQNLDKNVQIFNVLGKQVLAKTISGTSINVSNLNAGIYIVKVEEAGNTVTRKLVIK